MSQHDFDIANQTGALVRADFNNALLAIASNSSGAAAPSTTFSYQWWLDTTANLLKVRNAANTAWITVGTPSIDRLGLMSLSGATLSGALLSAVGSVGSPGISFNGDTDNGFYWVSANTWGLVANGVEYLRISPSGISFLGTGAATLLTGTTGQRPGSPVNGMVRYNSDLTSLDTYVNGAWKTIATPSSYPFAISDFSSSVNISFTRSLSGEFGEAITKTPGFYQYPWSTGATVLSGLPAHGVGSSLSQEIDISPCGEFLGIGGPTTPFLAIFQRTSTNWIKLPDVATLPVAAVSGVRFSPNGLFLAVCFSSSPRFHVYRKSGNVWTKITDPATLPSAGAKFVAWSGNSEFLSVGHSVSPFVSHYQFTGDTMTKIADPGSLPSTTQQAGAWTPDSRFFATVHAGTFYLYERTAGTTLTRNVISNPPAVGAVPGIAKWSNSGEFFIVLGNSGSPTGAMAMYQRSGSTVTRLSDPTTLPPASGAWYGLSWSADDRYLFIGHSVSPFLTVYERSSATFTKLADPTNLMSGTIAGLVCSPDSQFVYVIEGTSPKVYQTNTSMGDINILTMNKKIRAGF